MNKTVQDIVFKVEKEKPFFRKPAEKGWSEGLEKQGGVREARKEAFRG